MDFGGYYGIFIFKLFFFLTKHTNNSFLLFFGWLILDVRELASKTVFNFLIKQTLLIICFLFLFLSSFSSLNIAEYWQVKKNFVFF
jgi:hypothetical protein